MKKTVISLLIISLLTVSIVSAESGFKEAVDQVLKFFTGFATAEQDNEAKLILRPNGAGSETAIPNAVGCTNHWECVDEATTDNSATTIWFYGEPGNPYYRDLFNLQDLPGPGTINKITVYVRTQQPYYPIYAYIAIKPSNTVYESNQITIPGSPPTYPYTLYSNTWTTNPDTGSAWTWSEINNLQAGIRQRSWWYASDNYGTARITQVYVEVEYTPLEPEKLTPPCGNYGDVNNDGYITKDDADLISNYIVGNVDLTSDQKSRADVNADGQITIYDAMFISQHTTGSRTTFPVCEITCTDSDYGKNYYTKGKTCIGENDCKIDVCIHADCAENADCVGASDLVLEYYCENDKRSDITKECLYGCQDGACMKAGEYILSEGETGTYTFNGVVYKVTALYIGDVKGARFNVNGETTDYIVEGDSFALVGGVQINVIDIFVQDLSGGVKTVKFTITVFEDEPSVMCTDSDGGFNYYVKGVCYDGTNTLADECIDANILKEYLCNNNICEESHNSPFVCPNGCQYGACIKTSLPGFEDYPGFLIKDNFLYAILVVGDGAPAEDVIAVSDIAVSLQYYTEFPAEQQGNVIRIDVGAVKLASEVANPKAQNMILVGRPTKYAGSMSNVLIDAFALPSLTSGDILLKIAENGNYYAVIVTGTDKDGPREASKILANWKDNSNLLIGQEVIVSEAKEDIAEAFLKIAGNTYKIVSASDINQNDFSIFVDINGNSIIGDKQILINGNESEPISKDIYFYLWGYGLLQYKGADKATSGNLVMKFKDIPTGDAIEITYVAEGNIAKATLKMGGMNYAVISASNILWNDFNIKVDMDGNGVIGDRTVNIVGDESIPVQKNDYVFLIGYDLVQYKGADKATSDNPVMKFKDIPTGNAIEISYTTTTAECTSDANCPSEVKHYCDGKDACTYMYNYKCQNGKCILDEETSIGECEICEYGCKNADCITGPIVVEGETWKVETSTNKLELSESLISGVNRESIADITTQIDDTELPNVLASGTTSNSKGDAPYDQKLYFEDTTTGYVQYLEDSQDVTADFLYFQSGKQIAKYELGFTTALASDVDDSAGFATPTGLYLTDFENVDIKMLGKTYSIVSARRLLTDYGGENSIKLILMGGEIKDTLLEGNTKTYTIDGVDYAVTLDFVDSDSAKFTINGESTRDLQIGEMDKMSSGLYIGVSETLYQNVAGGVHMATFFLGAQKIELNDMNVEDTVHSNSLKVNDELIDDALVIIEGTNDNYKFEINKIIVNMLADDDFYVPAWGGLSENPELIEPEVLFTQNWDIEYRGLTDQLTNDIIIKTAGFDDYELEFVDGSGNKATIPLINAVADSIIRFGDINDDLIIQENKVISKDDYFIVTGESAEDSRRKTYALRYRGADNVGTDDPTIKFDDLGSGERIERTIGLDGSAQIKIGGLTFNVVSASSPEIKDFDINVDLNGDGTLGNNVVSIYTNYGAGIAIDGIYDNEVRVVVVTPNSNDYDNLVPTPFIFDLYASNGQVRMDLDSNQHYLFRTPDTENNVQYAYSSYGAFATYAAPVNEPQTLNIKYPQNQRLPQVYITGGDVTYTIPIEPPPEEPIKCDNGCLDKDNNCLPVTTRTATTYCDIDKILKDQIAGESSCNNNYECQSNICIDRECTSLGLFQQFIKWFQGIF